MGTFAVEPVRGGQRSPETDVNHVPMLGLLLCCLGLLLVTAVWTHGSGAEGLGGGAAQGPRRAEPEPVLHVDMSRDRTFELTWRAGRTVLARSEVPRQPAEAGAAPYPELARRVQREWSAHGSHRNVDDRAQDRAVIHAGTRATYEDIVATMTALRAATRQVAGAPQPVAVFRVAFAED